MLSLWPGEGEAGPGCWATRLAGAAGRAGAPSRPTTWRGRQVLGGACVSGKGVARRSGVTSPAPIPHALSPGCPVHPLTGGEPVSSLGLQLHRGTPATPAAGSPAWAGPGVWWVLDVSEWWRGSRWPGRGSAEPKLSLGGRGPHGRGGIAAPGRWWVAQRWTGRPARCPVSLEACVWHRRWLGTFVLTALGPAPTPLLSAGWTWAPPSGEAGGPVTKELCFPETQAPMS